MTQVFRAKNLSKHAIFVSISTFEYFHVKIKAKFAKTKLRTVLLEIVRSIVRLENH